MLAYLEILVPFAAQMVIVIERLISGRKMLKEAPPKTNDHGPPLQELTSRLIQENLALRDRIDRLQRQVEQLETPALDIGLDTLR